MNHFTLALLIASAFIGAASAKDCSMVPTLLEAKFGDIGLAAGDCLNDIVSTVTKRQLKLKGQQNVTANVCP